MEQLTEQLRRHCSSGEKLEQGEEGGGGAGGEGGGGGGDIGQDTARLNGKVFHK